MRFIENANNPVKILKSGKKMNYFLKKKQKDSDNNQINTVKVVGIFHGDTDVNFNLVKMFRSVAHSSRTISELRFAILTDKTEVSLLQEKYGEAWFE